jgi:hypothetical protein
MVNLTLDNLHLGYKMNDEKCMVLLNVRTDISSLLPVDQNFAHGEATPKTTIRLHMQEASSSV